MYTLMLRLAVVVLVLTSASLASAELRGVVIVLARDKEEVTKVTIHSDVKEEKKTDVSLAAAVKVIEAMKDWGSGVMVCIVADPHPKLGASQAIPPPADLTKLLTAVEANSSLSLVYLRVGDAKDGDALVKHFIKSTSGK